MTFIHIMKVDIKQFIKPFSEASSGIKTYNNK